MRSLLFDLSTAFSNIYSGWIIWNLFLAFIPLVLSFLLFRRNTMSQRWLWFLCVLVGFIGVVGFWPKAYYLAPNWARLIEGVLEGDRTALLRMGWLLLLALFSFAMSILMFRRQQSARKWFWWLGFLIFVAFLPNAPYLLTDIIHLIRGVSSGQIPAWTVVLIFIPIHLTSILLGFEAYVVSLINQSYYLKKNGSGNLILPAELLMHALSAIGVYLGRFIRFNSWDLVTEPSSIVMTTLNALTTKWPAAAIIVTFVILTVLYWGMKQVTLGLKLRIHYARMGLDAID